MLEALLGADLDQTERVFAPTNPSAAGFSPGGRSDPVGLNGC